MKPNRSRLLAVALLAGFAFGSAPASAEVQASLASPSPGTAPAVSPLPLPSSSPSPSPKPDPKRLLKEFQKAQKAQVKAVEHRQRFEMRELEASQRAREREWFEKEKEARHKFVDEKKPTGTQFRAYMKDFLKRRDAFHQLLKDERKQRAQEQEARLKALKKDQDSTLKEFEDFLKKGEIPPERLWPDESY